MSGNYGLLEMIDGVPVGRLTMDAKPQMLHIASDRTKAGPIVSASGLDSLDEYFAWRRSTEARPRAHAKSDK